MKAPNRRVDMKSTWFRIQPFLLWLSERMVDDRETEYVGFDQKKAAMKLFHFIATHFSAPGVTRTFFPVAAVRAFVNDEIARDDVSDQYRALMVSAYEQTAFEAKDYHGYNDLYWGWEGGYEAWRAAGSPENEEKQKFFDILGRKFRRRYYGEEYRFELPKSN